jgi:thiamine-phosphate pyrophosphorylase
MSLAAQLRLMVITDPVLLKGRDAVDVCRRAVRGGATMVQVRWKGGAPAAVVELARALVPALSVPVIVNDRVDVALAAGAAGAHLGWDDVPVAAVRAIVPAGFILGLSVGSLEEAHHARSLPADYWSIGSCFATGTKDDAGVPLGVEGFARLARAAPRELPVIAIGGITAASAAPLRRAGAAGVAVVGAIMAATDPERAAAELWQAVAAAP